MGVWGLRPQPGFPPLHPVLSLVTMAIQFWPNSFLLLREFLYKR